MKFRGFDSNMVFDAGSFRSALYSLKYLATLGHPAIREAIGCNNCQMISADFFQTALELCGWKVEQSHTDPSFRLVPDSSSKHEINKHDAHLFTQLSDCFVPGSSILFWGTGEYEGLFEKWTIRDGGLEVERGWLEIREVWRPVKERMPKWEIK